MGKEKYTIEPCTCCQEEHGNPNGWILRNNDTGMPEYHIDLKPGKPTIGELPKK